MNIPPDDRSGAKPSLIESRDPKHKVRLRVTSFIEVSVRAPWPSAALDAAELELRKQIRGGRRLPRDSFVEALDVARGE